MRALHFIPHTRDSKERLLLGLVIFLAFILSSITFFVFSPKHHPLSAFSAIAMPSNTISQPTRNEIYVGPAARELISKLQSNGFTPAAIKNTSSNFFTVQGKVTTLANDNIIVYEYSDTLTAQQEAAAFAKKQEATRNSWRKKVHVFAGDKIIVTYVGERPEILQSLESIFGKILPS